MVFGMKRSPKDTGQISVPVRLVSLHCSRTLCGAAAKKQNQGRVVPEATWSPMMEVFTQRLVTEQRPGGHMDDLFLPNWEAWSSDIDRARGD